ncbi:FAD-dependent oxidoreductase [Kitasatospora sp. NBC_01287]|uniref:NAD(P)/FAD-dependent oxidoreductase n=1 Tax=Kitasatospora sp. NBC_01287 TaxID=2903573 RepID=UPI00224F7D85|nr:FAD-dependent oxidoreductase [Kitasatospora sp. NBC_01287]MCX4747425.1 FAD-dependent oxidoreductase [Kitasatospora sp. NBC_01287]
MSSGGGTIRILIVGGGCAGLTTAQRLQRELQEELRAGRAEITVIEAAPYLTYRPLLAEVAAGSIDPRHVVVPLRRALPDCRVLTARITRIDHGRRLAWLAPSGGVETELAYDELVLTAGSVSRTRPIPGLAEFGVGFETVGEAVSLRNHVLDQLDLASSTRDPELRDAALTFVFVGAGYGGVGALAELEDMARQALRGYPNIQADDLRWVLVEAGDRILAEADPGLAEHALAQLRERNVDIRLATTLDSAQDRVMALSDGSRFAARTLVWTAGVRPAPVLAATDLPLDEAGRVRCLPTLQAVDADGRALPGAWAAGDCAAVPAADPAGPGAAATATAAAAAADAVGETAGETAGETVGETARGAFCAPNAWHALAQGELLAENLLAVAAGQTPYPYRPARTYASASLGLRRAVAHTRKGSLTGRRAWLLHRARTLRGLPSPDRRVRVLADWLLGALFTREAVSLASVEHPRAEFEAAAGNPES